MFLVRSDSKYKLSKFDPGIRNASVSYLNYNIVFTVVYLGNLEGVPNEFSGKNTGTMQTSFKNLKVFIGSRQAGFWAYLANIILRS